MASRFFKRTMLPFAYVLCGTVLSPSSGCSFSSARFASLVVLCTRQVIKMPQSSRMNNEEPDVAHYYRILVVEYSSSNVCLLDWLSVHGGQKLSKAKRLHNFFCHVGYFSV